MKEIPFKIIENSWLAKVAAKKMKSKSIAVTFGKSVHIYGVSKEKFILDKRWMAHELVHVHQYQKLGFFNFLIQYLMESVRKGYYQNKFEVEARERTDEYLMKYLSK